MSKKKPSFHFQSPYYKTRDRQSAWQSRLLPRAVGEWEVGARGSIAPLPSLDFGWNRSKTFSFKRPVITTGPLIFSDIPTALLPTIKWKINLLESTSMLDTARVGSLSCLWNCFSQPGPCQPAHRPTRRPDGRAATAAGLGREINLFLEEVIFRPNVHVVVPGRNGSLFYIFDR